MHWVGVACGCNPAGAISAGRKKVAILPVVLRLRECFLGSSMQCRPPWKTTYLRLRIEDDAAYGIHILYYRLPFTLGAQWFIK